MGQCKENYSCNHVTGMCNKGCDGGWTRELCNDGKLDDFTTQMR